MTAQGPPPGGGGRASLGLREVRGRGFRGRGGVSACTATRRAPGPLSVPWATLPGPQALSPASSQTWGRTGCWSRRPTTVCS